MGSFASDIVKTIKEDDAKNGTVDLKVMCKSIAKQVATLFEALSTVIAQRDLSKNSVESTFPVLPSMIVSTRGRKFTSMIQQH